MTEFQQAVMHVVRAIPLGEVASYGQVAAYIGTPRAARQVGWALRSMEGEDFPWWRVVNNQGRISIKGTVLVGAQQQKELLQAEGVEVNDDFGLAIERYRFRPDRAMMLSWRLDEEYIEVLLRKYDF